MVLIVFACPSFVGACMCNQMLLFRRLVFVSDRKPPNASFSQTTAEVLSEVESCLLSPLQIMSSVCVAASQREGESAMGKNRVYGLQNILTPAPWTICLFELYE